MHPLHLDARDVIVHFHQGNMNLLVGNPNFVAQFAEPQTRQVLVFHHTGQGLHRFKIIELSVNNLSVSRNA